MCARGASATRIHAIGEDRVLAGVHHRVATDVEARVTWWGRWKSWWAANWKWVVFPVGVASAIIGVVAAVLRPRPVSRPPEPERVRSVLEQLRTADAERRSKVEELEREHAEQLRTMSEEQLVQLEQLQDKSLEEVVEWFNNL